MDRFDVIVIGGGPAGVTAALRARELGASVALVERNQLGGTCTNDGCLPTRVLAKAARLMRDSKQFSAYGLTSIPPTVDFPRLLEHTQRLIYTVHEKKQIQDHLEQAGVRTFTLAGDAQFVDPHTVVLANGAPLAAEKIILCVGGHARRMSMPGSEYVLTHSDVWRMRQLPKSVAIIGGAATGCQLASIFAAFGVDVTLLEMAPRILAAEDPVVSDAMLQAFRGHGIVVHMGIGGVQQVQRGDAGLQLAFVTDNTPATLDVECVIGAVGWVCNTAKLNLDAAGVRVERGYIWVDDTLRTSVPHIYAAGDSNGRMMLVQSAGYEARIAAENAVLDGEQRYQTTVVPHGSFTDPEYASVGLTEAAALAAYECAVAVVPYADLDRAVIDGCTDGFCKLIVDMGTRRLLGAHVVGEDAVEIVHVVAAGMAANMGVEQLAELEIAYPTLTAVLGLAARKIVRDLGLTEVAPHWRALGQLHPAEWEQRAG